MSDDLTAWIARQIDESGLGDDAGLVVLAALEGDEELTQCLSGRYERSVIADAADRPEANQVFLTEIVVTGFRGIGPHTSIAFQPGPGLTIVAGRNGSGKSSLSEALELALTGNTYRWKERPRLWREKWRNIHNGAAPSIEVGLVEQGIGPLRIFTAWPSVDSEDVDSAVTHSQRKGEKKALGTETLGWETPLARFRPLLSYDELGGLLDGRPSALYDAVAGVLGVEQVGDALKRIQTRLKELKAPETALSKQRKELLALAQQSDDERADTAARMLRKTAPDHAALRSLASGSAVSSADDVQSRLRELAGAPADLSTKATAVVDELRGAIAALADAGGTASAMRLKALDLRQRAQQLHQEFGDQDCPVCGSGRLDAAWASETVRMREGEGIALQAVTAAQRRVSVAVQDARRLHDLPVTRDEPIGVTGIDEALDQLRQSSLAWMEFPAHTVEEPRTVMALADHIAAHHADLDASFAVVREAAAAALDTRQRAWEPLAAQIAGWCHEWEAQLESQSDKDLLSAAEKWLKENDLRLKNERIAPIRDGARHAWSLLRQESNVEINDLVLEGTTTRRQIRIDSAIDGTEAGSLAVLSQGELHALSLSLFLPRATMAESPFRFVVLDDPVQAMDPAKVDGLVQLLSELARTHQVIVFSHDDRLPEAARRARVSARILEVRRGGGSVVTVRSASDPVSRYLSDAEALISDKRLPDEALRRTLPGMLRFAVEAAARERFFERRLSKGEPMNVVEEVWSEQRQTRHRVSLALRGEVVDLNGWLRQHNKRALAMGIVGPGMHNGLKPNVDPDEAVHAVRVLIAALRDAS